MEKPELILIEQTKLAVHSTPNGDNKMLVVIFMSGEKTYRFAMVKEAAEEYEKMLEGQLKLLL